MTLSFEDVLEGVSDFIFSPPTSQASLLKAA